MSQRTALTVPGKNCGIPAAILLRSKFPKGCLEELQEFGEVAEEMNIEVASSIPSILRARNPTSLLRHAHLHRAVQRASDFSVALGVMTLAIISNGWRWKIGLMFGFGNSFFNSRVVQI
jgi:hypothetical protein